jgi:hypothetical protein
MLVKGFDDVMCVSAIAIQIQSITSILVDLWVEVELQGESLMSWALPVSTTQLFLEGRFVRHCLLCGLCKEKVAYCILMTSTLKLARR